MRQTAWQEQEEVDDPGSALFSCTRWLRSATIAGLAAAVCCGCSHIPRMVNLNELILLESSVYDPQTGMYDKPVTLFYSRKTGKRVRGIDMIVRSVFHEVIGVSALSEGLAVARRESEGNVGYIDAAGRVVIPFQYREADPFHEGRAKVWMLDENEKFVCGLIDRKGKWVVPPGRYEELGLFREGRCAFRSGKRWGFLDVLGREAFSGRLAEPTILHGLPVFHQGLAAVRTAKNRWMYVDRYGRTPIKPPDGTIELLGDFHGGMARFAISVPEEQYVWILPIIISKTMYGYIGITGRVVIPPTYRQAGDFSEGLAPVSKNAEVVFLDIIHPPITPDEGDAWGYVDTTGKVVIPFRFSIAGRFSGGLARVQQDGKWGYIDTTGKFVIPPRYLWAFDFRDGIAEVWYKGRIVFIDRTGTVLVKTGLSATSF